MNDNVATKADIKTLEVKLDQLAQFMRDGFDTLNGRFDEVEAKVDNLELKIDSLEGLALELKQRLRKAEAKIQRLDARVGETILRLEGLGYDVKKIYKSIDQIRLKYADELEQRPAQEKRLKKLETFVGTIAKRIGLKIS